MIRRCFFCLSCLFNKQTIIILTFLAVWFLSPPSIYSNALNRLHRCFPLSLLPRTFSVSITFLKPAFFIIFSINISLYLFYVNSKFSFTFRFSVKKLSLYGNVSNFMKIDITVVLSLSFICNGIVQHSLP